VTAHQPAVTVWLRDLSALEPARRQSILDREEQHRNRLVNLVTAAQQEGGIRAEADPRLVSLALLGSMNWVHRWFRSDGLPADEVGRQFSRVYLIEP